MHNAALTKEDIFKGLHRLDEKARKEGVLIELAVYGGAALALLFDLREITRDVDVAMHGDNSFIREAAKEVAEELDWPEDWLNDRVKGFLSHSEELQQFPDFQGHDECGLRLFTPSPAYLFAMKCMSMRPEGIEGAHDIEDIKGLARLLGLSSAAEAFEIVEAFYPRNKIPPKTMFGIEEIMEDLNCAPEDGAPRTPRMG